MIPEKKLDILKDTYYTDEYISLYLTTEDRLFEFEYREGEQLFFNKTIKRPIKQIGGRRIEDGYFDLESAYGYGGYYTNTEDKLFLKKALSAYKVKCQEENIIAEFMRSHPFNDFAQKHSDLLDFCLYDRDLVVVSLDQELLKNYKPKTRNAIKRASEKVSFQESKNIEKFIELYTATMTKNEADDFYFFNKKQYNQLLDLEQARLFEITAGDDIIAMGFFLFGEDLCHYHLSANSPLSYQYNSNYVLLHNLFMHAQELGKKFFVLGGGTTNIDTDPLFMFKKKFSNELRPFYIAGQVFNQAMYDQYNQIWLDQSAKDIKYFLKYRSACQLESSCP